MTSMMDALHIGEAYRKKRRVPSGSHVYVIPSRSLDAQCFCTIKATAGHHARQKSHRSVRRRPQVTGVCHLSLFKQESELHEQPQRAPRPRLEAGTRPRRQYPIPNEQKQSR